MSLRFIRSPLRGVFFVSLLAAVSLMSAGAAQASTLPTLTLTLTKSSITVAGATQSGGVNVVSTATGVKEANVILFLLKPGATFDEVEAAVKTAAWRYQRDEQVRLARIRRRSDSRPEQRSPDVPATRSICCSDSRRRRQGVEGARALHGDRCRIPRRAAGAEATIRSIEFGFRGPSTLHDGELVRFENEGFLVHMDIAAPVKNMKAARQAVKDLLSGKEKALEKLDFRASRGLRWAAVTRSFPAGDDHRQARLLRRGLLHGHSGRAQPLPAGDGAHHQNHQVTLAPRPVPSACGAGCGGLRSRHIGQTSSGAPDEECRQAEERVVAESRPCWIVRTLPSVPSGASDRDVSL